jgi:hypothetical protein
MSAEIIDGIEFFLYKIASLLVGLAFCYMGYRLFLAGLVKAETDVEFRRGDIAIKLAKAAPGTCYAIFGAVIVGCAIWKGYSSTGKTITSSYQAIESAPQVQLPERFPRN